MKHIITLLLSGLIFVAGSLSGAPADAGEMTWRLKSEHPNTVSLEFYSQDRNHVWPGDGQIYLLDDWDTHAFSLTCRNNELICFGAWVRNGSDTYWGSGLDDKNSCENCCARCGQGEVQTQVLKP